MLPLLLALFLSVAHADTETETGTETATATATPTITPTRTGTITATATVTNTPCEWRVCVGTVPVLIATAVLDRLSLTINPEGPERLSFGDALVTAGIGPELSPLDLRILTVGDGCRQEFWGVVAQGTCCVRLHSYSP